MNSDSIRHVQKYEAIVGNEDVADAYLVEKQITRLERYREVGRRRFEALPHEILTAQWVDAYRQLIAAPHEAFRWDVFVDVFMPLHREFFLRRIEPPIDQVEADIAQFDERLERLRCQEEPDAVALKEAEPK